jgi:VIT1/CCC1 family predicted Fe2+/Mn2+ transporter
VYLITRFFHRIRAMMMGALDGLLSVAAVMLGVGGGTGDLNSMRLAGIAAWIAGALSMFMGECVHYTEVFRSNRHFP